MKASEFRIGNKLLFGNYICDVTEIQKNCFYVSNEDGVEFKNTTCDLQPIPLTEEILLKCGFNYSGGVYFLPNDFGVYASLRNGWIINNTQEVGSVKGIRYLHQLQNLYYALTQTELEIKL